MKINSIGCGVCGDRRLGKVFWLDYVSGLRSKKIYINECPKCGLLYAYRGQDNAPDLYSETYRGSGGFGGLKGVLHGRLLNWRARSFVSRYGKDVRVLEVGCGEGEFLVKLRGLGVESVVGVELNAYAAGRARGKGLDVRIDSFSGARLRRGYYDVILMHHVIEHFEQPRQAVKKVWRLLGDGGHLIMTTPNCNSVARAMFGRYWHDWKPPYHLSIFSPDTIRHLIVGEGFLVKSVKHEIYPTDIESSLILWLKDKGVSAEKLYFVFAVVFLPFGFWVSLLKRSSRMVVVAEKVG